MVTDVSWATNISVNPYTAGCLCGNIVGTAYLVEGGEVRERRPRATWLMLQQLGLLSRSASEKLGPDAVATGADRDKRKEGNMQEQVKIICIFQKHITKISLEEDNYPQRYIVSQYCIYLKGIHWIVLSSFSIQILSNITLVHAQIKIFYGSHASVVSIFNYLLCDTLTSSATFHTPEVTKQSWKLRCPVQKMMSLGHTVHTPISPNIKATDS